MGVYWVWFKNILVQLMDHDLLVSVKSRFIFLRGMLWKGTGSQVREVCHSIFTGSFQGILLFMPSNKTFGFVCISGHCCALSTGKLSPKGGTSERNFSALGYWTDKQKKKGVFTCIEHIRWERTGMYSNIVLIIFSLVVFHMFALQSVSNRRALLWLILHL